MCPRSRCVWSIISCDLCAPVGVTFSVTASTFLMIAGGTALYSGSLCPSPGQHASLYSPSAVWGHFSIWTAVHLIIVCSFLKDISYAHQGCIYLIENTVKQFNCEILLQFKISVFYFNIFENIIYSCVGKAEFSAAITSAFSVTWSFRNPSNMLICCSRNIYYHCWKQLFCLILLRKLWYNFFCIFWWIES